MRGYDVIVVGGGTAGVAAAVTLAEAGAEVCLVEAGRSDRDHPMVSDIRRWQDVLGSEADWAVRALPPPEHLVYSAGRVLGGSSTLNNVWAFDLPDADLRAWSASGITGWSPEDVEAARSSVRDRVAASPVEQPHGPSLAFLAAAEQFGVPAARPGGAVLGAGHGLVPLAARGERRWSSADAYLGDARRPPRGLTLELGTAVRRVLLGPGARVIGVQTDRESIEADEVVLSCGALHTPRLLMVSGIGPAEHLAEHGIEVVVDSPQVGQHLQDHPLVGVTWRAAQEVPPPLTHGWEAAALLSASVSDEECDLMVLCAAAPPSLSGATRDRGTLTLAAYLARPHSRGAVRLSGPTTGDPVRVTAPLLTDPEGQDLHAMARATELLRELGSQPALVEWLGAEMELGADHPDLAAFVRASTGTMYHPTSTCRMGAVVDAGLSVRGAAGLRVADASVLPTVTTVPPYLTCLTVGERCAQLVMGARIREGE